MCDVVYLLSINFSSQKFKPDYVRACLVDCCDFIFRHKSIMWCSRQTLFWYCQFIIVISYYLTYFVKCRLCHSMFDFHSQTNLVITQMGRCLGKSILLDVTLVWVQDRHSACCLMFCNSIGPDLLTKKHILCYCSVTSVNTVKCNVSFCWISTNSSI